MVTDVETIQRVFVQAMADPHGFTRHGSRMGTWDVSRGCLDPTPVTMASRATGSLRAVRLKKRPAGIELVLLTPCRRCEVCLRKHAALWRGRACTEIEYSARTWFGTMTCRPDIHVWVDHVCATRERDFWNLSPDKKFAARTKVLGEEATKFLKRVRKQSGHRIRYLLVTEIHDGERTSYEMRGRPHLHMLLHEFPGQQVPKRLLESQWVFGHSSWRLTEGQGAAWYVSKYISKATDARVRASVGYGSRTEPERSEGGKTKIASLDVVKISTENERAVPDPFPSLENGKVSTIENEGDQSPEVLNDTKECSDNGN